MAGTRAPMALPQATAGRDPAGRRPGTFPTLLTLLVLLASAALAGCTATVNHGTTAATPSPTTSKPGATSPPPAVGSPFNPNERMTIHGVVVDAALHPLDQANTTLLEAKQTQKGSTFRFEDLSPNAYTLTVRAAGFGTRSLVVTPAEARSEVRFVLDADRTQGVYNVTQHFHGLMQCALEAVIISPSCDTAITAVGGPSVTPSNTSFIIAVDAGWKTLVTDVVFDSSSQSGLAGMRVTVQGSSDQSQLGVYEQYGRFESPSSFTFRVAPGGVYPDGVKPVPTNTTQFRFDAYPQSHAWHATCQDPAPSMGPCLLGAGAGIDVEFDLYVTTFYGQEAPANFTMMRA